MSFACKDPLRCDTKNWMCGPCRKMWPGLAASMDQAKRERKNQSNNRPRRNNGGWQPRQTGTLQSGETVTFRQGSGDNEGHTLIADGEKSSREFDRNHNHYGPKREGDGRVEDDDNRDNYTGPDN